MPRKLIEAGSGARMLRSQRRLPSDVSGTNLGLILTELVEANRKALEKEAGPFL